MAELSVSKRSIGKYLTETLKDNSVKYFIIPEYQRPYSWDADKCRTLWEDIRDFRLEPTTDASSEYFLGTIVSCPEEGKGINIIDGQQRITSFFLLLRAFYTKLEKMNELNPSNEEVVGLMKQVGACIWDVNPKSQKVTDKGSIHIQSKVATEKDNDILHAIIATGTASNGKSHYEENYRYFQEQCDAYAKDSTLDWEDLCLFILNQCIILPIECKDLDIALTIFHTLNDRGMPLADADIFKAQLYKMQEEGKKEEFTETWKELSLTLDDVGLTLNDLFRYYTHYIRADAGDNSKEIGLRKFYQDNHYEKLRVPHIMDDLKELAGFWSTVLKEDGKALPDEVRKLIHCLLCYPNEYWKYPTTVFFFKHKTDYADKLPAFLKNLMSFLFVKFLENPSVNAIKDPIFNACISVYNTGEANFSYPVIDFEQRMNALSNSKITKPMLLLHTYLYDEEQGRIDSSFQIEHIFPQKWNNTYFTWSDEEAMRYINKFGNKIPLEWRLNIQASNGFYGKKKEYYEKSKYLEVKSLLAFNDWGKEEIDKRNDDMIARLKAFFEENLIGKEMKVEKLLEYSGGAKTIEVSKITSGSKSSFRLIVNGESENDFETFEAALANIPKGLLQFGTQILLHDDVASIVQSFINE
ncbi:MAG: DUF262 domain-containing HNH endonuclease family protein [Bacteroidales bacterium]|nr:DUF262 domain-containing HNH endonuclease family protein [Bacteroidales bacterium]